MASVGQEKLAIRGQATCDNETCSVAAVSQRMICGRKARGGDGVSRTKEPTSWPIAHQIERTVRRYWCEAGTKSVTTLMSIMSYMYTT